MNVSGGDVYINLLRPLNLENFMKGVAYNAEFYYTDSAEADGKLSGGYR